MTGRPAGIGVGTAVLVLVAALSLAAVPHVAADADGSVAGTEVSITDISLERSTIAPGDAAEVRVTVENVGDVSASRSLQLTGNGRAYVQTLVRLNAGESRTIVFDHSFDTPGEYDLAVDGVSAGVLTVAAGRATEAPTTEPGSTPAPDSHDGEVTLTAWVLIVVLGAALAAGSIYFVRQR